ncbi:MAG: methylated-DNA--[protein]-cysteine S-methyltransferase [Planctomycetia bacterium]|nr:methylated-DNA--[protein]-cysteine S-methyltransferase [Planctomycetia bacterium]
MKKISIDGNRARRKPARSKSDELRFAIGRSALGAVLVATGTKGVAAILLGENPSFAIEALQRCFPKSQFVEGTSDDEARLAKVLAHIEDPPRPLGLRLDLRGTAFQNRVWRVVQRIPVGKTLTYAEVAKKIGAPRAMRAVGSACANCHHYFAVPCHRVTPSGNSPPARPRPGADRRHALLQRERKLIGAES